MWLLLSLACAGPSGGAPADPTAPPARAPDTGVAACEGVVAPGWDDWGNGFFGTWCRSCHSASTADRRGAPVTVNFDTWAEVDAGRESIARTVLEYETMPVGGGLSDDDRALLTLLLACGAGGDEGSAAGVVPAPSFTGDDVSARAVEVLAAGLPLATDFYAVFGQLMDAHGEERCPNNARAPYAVNATKEGCTTSEGWFFAGLTTRLTTNGPNTTDDLMGGDGHGTDPLGQELDFAGELEWGVSRSGDTTSWYQAVEGTWGYEGTPGWMALLPSALVRVEATSTPVDLVATVHGGVSTPGHVLFFDALVFDPGACPGGAASGAIRLRDDAGYWYTTALRDDCSGCGDAVYADGTSVGEACFDTSAFLASIERYTP